MGLGMDLILAKEVTARKVYNTKKGDEAELDEDVFFLSVFFFATIYGHISNWMRK
jgi:hypothetical protein